MKRFIGAMAAVALATALVGTTFNAWAQDENAPAASEKASKKGTGPFNGKVAAVDSDAGTVTIGSRTFKITSETKVTNGSLASAKVGDKTGGAFKTAEDGSLVATTIWFGSKPGAE
jgi:Cu/Ag efflux protein CusF